MAGLGLVLIADALAEGRFELVPFVVGLIMVGLVPVDALIDAATRPSRDEHDLERLREVLRDRDDEPDHEG